MAMRQPDAKTCELALHILRQMESPLGDGDAARRKFIDMAAAHGMNLIEFAKAIQSTDSTAR
jgi:hypothetical protein